MELRYEVVIRWDDEDACFIARAPELPGCMAHGDTYDEALHNIRGAMDAWLDVARELGRPIPLPRKHVEAA